MEEFELLEGERPVVQRRRQAEAVLHQIEFSRAVAVVHAAHLGHGHMALVDGEYPVVTVGLLEVVQQAVRARAGLAVVHVPRVVLDARAVADLLDHLDVEQRALLEALGRDQVALHVEHGEPPAQLFLDGGDGAVDLVLRRHEVLGRVDRHDRVLGAGHLARHGVDDLQLLDLVAPERDAVGHVFQVRREDLHHVAADAELAWRKLDVVAVVEDGDEAAQQVVAVDDVAGADLDELLLVLRRVAESVDAAHRRHDDHVAPAAHER